MSDAGARPPGARPARSRSFVVFLCYAALTGVMAYPFSLHPATGVLSPGTDTDYFIWALGWDVHALVHQPWSIFDANIFFPFRHTLAYSENVLGSAIFAAPIIWVTHNPMLAMNLLALLSIPLSGLGAYLLGRRVGCSEAAAVLCGLIFAFSPPRFLRLDQFHLTTIQWVPFALAYLHGYLTTGVRRDLRVAVAFFSLQAITSGHGGAMAVLGVVLVLAEWLIANRSVPVRKWAGDFGVAGALLMLPAVLIYLPYRAAQLDVGFRRVLDDWSISTSSFFTSASHVQTWLVARMPDWTWLKQDPDAWLFPGLVPLALAALAFLLPGSRDRASSAPRPVDLRWLYLAIVLLCIWFAVGPPYGVWRWVYWLPGLNFVRVPSRFMLLGTLGLGVLAAMGFDRLVAARGAAAAVVPAVAVGALMLVEFAVMPLDVQPYSATPPAIDYWLASQPGRFGVVEVPVPDSNSVITQERRNTLYMMHSLAHYKPIVEGFSGIQPPGYETMHDQLMQFPDEQSLRTMLRLGVTYAIEHVDLIPPVERATVAERYDRFKDWLTLVAVDGDGRVYRLHPPR